jgi:hypothetical protein
MIVKVLLRALREAAKAPVADGRPSGRGGPRLDLLMIAIAVAGTRK